MYHLYLAFRRGLARYARGFVPACGCPSPLRSVEPGVVRFRFGPVMSAYGLGTNPLRRR